MPWRRRGRGRLLRVPGRSLFTRGEGGWQPSQVLTSPSILVFRGQDLTGRALVPVVKKGDLVRPGTVLAGPQDAPEDGCLFSPVAGKVVDAGFRPAPDTGGSGLVPFVAIQPVAEAGAEKQGTNRRAGTTPVGDRLRHACRLAGVDPEPLTTAGIIVFNGCDPDEGVFGRRALLHERRADVAAGVTAILSGPGAPGNRQGWLAIAEGTLSATELAALRRDLLPAEVLLVPAGYPAGRPEMLAARFSNAAIVGVEIAAAVGRSLQTFLPPVDVLVSIGGDAVARPGTYRVPIGAPVSALLEAAGVDYARLRLLVRGGYLAGEALPLEDAYISLGDLGYLALGDAFLEASPGVGVCLHCGRCVAICPEGLAPAVLGRLARLHRWEEAARQGAEKCYACGLCAYACPARLPLVQLIRLAQHELSRRKPEKASEENGRQTGIASSSNGKASPTGKRPREQQVAVASCHAEVRLGNR
ncbi:MAG TPA: 4Fe-4S dicluster domain-containing protein [Firmicutes bacterium]|nr:4Fe-4S dicluster domain-containing protein [Bacillota bacterium]